MADDPAIWARARERLPLPALMRQLGDEAFTRPKSECPFCQKKKGWSVYLHNGRHWFKCHAPKCDGNISPYGHGEIGYLALRKGWDTKEASVEFLRLALPEEVADREREQASRGGSAAAPLPSAREGAAANVWHRLWQGMKLTFSDRSKLKEKRGFTDSTIDALGFRSNGETNLPVLEALQEEFPLQALIAEGIFKSTARGGVRPSGQLVGYGRTGEKGKDGKPIFAENHPILIPYLDAQGRPFYLRPHKGGVKRPKDEMAPDRDLMEDEDAVACAAHVYCPFIVSELIELNDGLCVLTEGEFKAAALFQCGIPAIACPGITFIRNAAFREELVGLLRTHGVLDLVVCFDNEVKDDPHLPSYKADPWNRYDTQVYAEYTAYDLREYFHAVEGSCRLGMLPDAEREPTTGKADFDGILAKYVKAHGTAEGTKRAGLIFREMIETAAAKPDAGLFPTEARRIIECKLQRIFYRPQIGWGDRHEETLARHFGEVDPKTKTAVDAELADAFRQIRGCYYKRVRPKTNGHGDGKDPVETINDRIDELEKNKDRARSAATSQELHFLYSYRKAIWERRKGIPENISTFTLTCEYRLHSTDGTVIRLVRVRDSKRQGPTPEDLYRLSPSDLARLADFRKWGYAMGEAVWKGGDKELQALVQDMDHFSFLRDIYEVPMYGLHEESGLWFFGDCAFAPDGSMILKDKRGIFWHDGFGYQIDDRTTAEGSCFMQGPPLLLTPQGGIPPREKPDVGQIFRQMADDLFDTIGDFEGWMSIGLMLAQAASPELSVKGGCPGLFLYGPMSGGKTTIARWLARIWGFPHLGGISLGTNTTTVGMSRALGQYHYLPVWFDEYRRHTIDDQKEAILRNAFDGAVGAKGTADPKRTRSAEAQTTPMVTGESSSRDSATRSRYGHVFVSLHKRIGDGSARFPRIQDDCKHYYNIGRWLMENRAAYVTGVVQVLDSWTGDQEVRSRIPNDRLRFVYGVAFACFSVVAEMLGVFTDGSRLGDYRNALIEIGARGLAEVVEESFLNQFWRDVLGALERGDHVKPSYFSVCFRKLDENGALRDCRAEDPDALHVCYLSPSAIFGAYQKDMSQRREGVPMSESDIRRELEKQPYWLPAPHDKYRVHRKRMEGGRSCWVILLDRVKQEGDTPEEADSRPFLFPFTEDLETLLTTNEKPT